MSIMYMEIIYVYLLPYYILYINLNINAYFVIIIYKKSYYKSKNPYIYIYLCCTNQSDNQFNSLTKK